VAIRHPFSRTGSQFSRLSRRVKYRRDSLQRRAYAHWPLLLAAIGLLFSVSATVALIWVAHIGFDRLVGYGLKYGAGFNYTHLGLIGRMSADKT